MDPLDTAFLRKPRAWPGGKRCAVCVTLDFDGHAREIGLNQVPLGRHSHGRYVATCGLPRYLRMFGELGIPTTHFVPGHDAELTPEIVREIAARGHEVGAHGYVHEKWDPGEAEPELLRRTHAILTGVAGRAPVGWRNPGGSKSERTMRTLIELGYLYDSSDKDYDLPFEAITPTDTDRRLMILPNETSSLDDYPLYRIGWVPPSQVLRQWIDEWEVIRQEGGFLNLTLHPRIGYGSGSPARAQVVRDFIRHVQASGEAVFLTMADLARWCIARKGEWTRDWAREEGQVPHG